MTELLTSSEARTLLGNMSPSTFKNLVDSGKIRKVTPPGKSQGKYIQEDVIKIAAELKPFIDADHHSRQLRRQAGSYKENPSHPAATDWTKASDLPYLLAFDYEMYGVENTVDISITHKWWEKNPYMARLLFNANDRKDIWGAITIMPMKEETIFRILRDELKERDITADDILTYQPGNEYIGYVASATVKKEYATHFRELLRSVFTFACDQYPDIKITKLYAYASSPEGWNLIKRLFFSPRKDLDRNAFELDLFERNPSSYLKSFHECLKHKGADIFEPEW
ncbi:hypothetical protein [Dictyobacter vulcani]|nr:hypothetical protein [Dictyobacter vulcani]